MSHLRRAWVLALALLIALNNCAFWLFLPPALQTEDRNGDGHSDVWRWYDAKGQLIRVEVDTNFDGRPDWLAEYHGNRITRIRIDSNYDNRIDEEIDFDAQTGAIVSDTVDLDRDGRADVRRLYARGTVVYSERAPATRAAGGAGVAGTLALFIDPFLNELTIQSGRDLPVASAATIGAFAIQGHSPGLDEGEVLCSSLRRPVVRPRSTPHLPLEPRGPPSSRFLSL